MKNILGIIPARSGSKGIPNKNLRELAGKPLLAYTAEAARTSAVFDRIVLTTDSEEIAELGRTVGLEAPFVRPKELAADDTPMLPVLQHAVRALEHGGWKPQVVVLLQPSSPLRRPQHIKDAVEMLDREDCDSVVSVIEIPQIFSPQKALRLENGFIRFWSAESGSITRRQQLEKTYAREGTVYAVRRDVLMEKNSIYGDRCLPLVLPVEESLNLDTLDDWDRAEKKLKTLSVEAA
jgi:CMP-N,N'-diacetyllegionaminic acid synthase